MISTDMLIVSCRMTLEDTIETFSYFIKEADALGLAYICLVRYAAKLDVEYDGEQDTWILPCLSIPTPNSFREETCDAPRCSWHVRTTDHVLQSPFERRCLSAGSG